MSKAKPHARRAARSRAFQVLYSFEFSPSASLGALRAAYMAMPEPADMEPNRDEPARPPCGFAWELVEGVWSKTRELDELIRRYARNWRLERVGRVGLTLMRLALYEMLFRPDVPPKVAMNEALELNRQYGEEKSRTFLNGVLDAAAKGMENGELLNK